MANTKAIGDKGEQIAAEYLESKGYAVLERNAKYCGCEADIICCCYENSDGTIVAPKKRKVGFNNTFLKNKDSVLSKNGVRRIIVFCEVKTRAGGDYGFGAEAVTPYKMGRYVTLAKAYMSYHHITDEDVRFDVIEVCDGEVNHIKDAFCENDARYPRRSF